MDNQINVAWMYPDILNLHGERGNVQALERVAELLNLDLKIERIDDIEAKIDFEKYDILLFNCGELKVVPTITKFLKPQIEELKQFIKQGKILFTTSTTSAFLGNEITLQNGEKIYGLGIIDVDFKERKMVVGDDIYFELEDGTEITGSQIQMVDVTLNDEEPFGTIKYGYGNNGRKDEGCKKNNLIYTNCLAPVLVKNPWLAEKLIREVCEKKQIDVMEKSPEYELERKSLEVTKDFIKKKMNKE